MIAGALVGAVAAPAPAVVLSAFRMEPQVPLGFAPDGDPLFGATDLAQQLGLDDRCAALFDDLGVAATGAGFADDLERLIREITDRLLPGGDLDPDQLVAFDACVAGFAPTGGLADGSSDEDGLSGGGVPLAVNGFVGGSAGAGSTVGGSSGSGGASGGGGSTSGGTEDTDPSPISTALSSGGGSAPGAGAEEQLVLATVSPGTRRTSQAPIPQTTLSGDGGSALAGVAVVPVPMTVVLLLSALAFGTLVRGAARRG